MGMNLFDRILLSIFKIPPKEDLDDLFLGGKRKIAERIFQEIKKLDEEIVIKKITEVFCVIDDPRLSEDILFQVRNNQFHPSLTEVKNKNDTFIPSDKKGNFCQVYLTCSVNNSSFLSFVVWDEDPHFLWTEKLNYLIQDFYRDDLPDEIVYYDLKRDGMLRKL